MKKFRIPRKLKKKVRSGKVDKNQLGKIINSFLNQPRVKELYKEMDTLFVRFPVDGMLQQII